MKWIQDAAREIKEQGDKADIEEIIKRHFPMGRAEEWRKNLQAAGVSLSDFTVPHLDITEPGPVDVSSRLDSKVLWVSVNGLCVLRICRIEQLVINGRKV